VFASEVSARRCSLVEGGGFKILAPASFLVDGKFGVRLNRSGKDMFVFKQQELEATPERLHDLAEFSLALHRLFCKSRQVYCARLARIHPNSSGIPLSRAAVPVWLPILLLENKMSLPLRFQTNAKFPVTKNDAGANILKSAALNRSEHRRALTSTQTQRTLIGRDRKWGEIPPQTRRFITCICRSLSCIDCFLLCSGRTSRSALLKLRRRRIRFPIPQRLELRQISRRVTISSFRETWLLLN